MKLKKNNKAKYSIKRQLILRCVIIIACTILFNWIMNYLFLENYYIASREDRLMQAYEIMEKYDATEHKPDGTFTDFDINMWRLCITYNLSFIITDGGSNTIKTSTDNTEQFNRLLNDVILLTEGGTVDNVKIIKASDSYTLGNVYDKSTGLNYITMWGYLSDGNSFMIRTALEGIHESVKVVTRFLLYMGIIAILVSIVLFYLVSMEITSPILKLTQLSEKMARLDFTEKFVSKRANEIDILGENFNSMSVSLEQNINELKEANERLQKDVDIKTKTDNLRKEFLSNVSHELKTPIALISGYAEGLKEAVSDDPENREFYCDVIMDEAKKMNKIVKQLMTLNSIEFGGYEPEFGDFLLSDLVRNSVQAGEIITKPLGIKVYVQCEHEVRIIGDEYLIEEVFRNYYNNAINHIGGEKIIKVSVEQNEEETALKIFNTGDNIPDESIEHIWEKFYKVDKARTREYGGSGIGLSIVKAVMEAHGGSYGVENEKDGVEFWASFKNNVVV